jgi:hypothetical protein
MKLLKVIPILAILFIGVMSSCDSEEISSANLIDKSMDKLSMNAQLRSSTNAGIYLGTAENFAILSKSGITNVSPSNITGDVGTSPIT